jgi:hypothetical protein
MKGHCVKGQATDIPDMKAGGVDLVIPSDGYCMNLEPSSSMMLTCDGKVNLLFLDPLRTIIFSDFSFPLFLSQVLHYMPRKMTAAVHVPTSMLVLVR